MGKKVLVIEDEEIIRKIYKTKLTIEGFEVDSAVDGKEGLEKAKVFLPDLILLDMMMPNLSGMDFLKQIKNDASLKNVSIIVLSNLPTEDAISEAMSLGATRYFLKIDKSPNQVVEEVKNVLAEKSTTSIT